jgi:hypothetical protein
MHSPAIALAWEIWRKNRTGHLLVLALIPASVVIFTGLALWIPETRGLPGRPSPAWALLLFPMLASLLWVLNAFTHSEGDSRRGFSGIPTRMFTLPVRTGFVVGCLALYGIAAVLATYFAWALLIRGLTGFALPLGWPAVSLATSMICFQAAVWGLASFPWIRILVISVGALGIITLNAMLAEAGVKHLERELILTAVLLSLLPLAIVAAWFGVRSERCGGWRPWGWLRHFWRAFTDALPRRTRSFPTLERAQFWFEWRRKGFFLSFALAFSIAGGACLYFPFASIADSGFPVAGVVWVAILPLWFGGVGGIGLAKSDYWSPEVAMQPFHAIQPVTDGELLTAKLKAATGIVVLGWGMGLLLVLALCRWERWREMWHVDDHLRRLLHWLPSDPIVAVLVVVLALVAFLLAAWKCVTDSLCLGLIGNRRTILRHSCLGIGVFSLVVGGGGWLCQSPAYLEKVRFALLLLIAVGFVLKFIDTVRSFVAVMRAGLLPISTLRLLSGLWFLIVASFAGFAALLWLHSPVPKPLLLLALVWIWPAGELFRCVINLSANRHR